MSHKILITGANGGIGQVLCQHFLAQDFDVFSGVRKSGLALYGEPVVYGDITRPFSLSCSVDTVIHCAGLAHKLDEAEELQYQAVNVNGTKNMMRAARKAGMKRFIYFSSIKVLGESTPNSSLEDNSVPSPQDSYARSKYDAEEFVKEYAKQYGLEVVIIRAPLVYGLDKSLGNLKALLKILSMGLPLPFSSIDNKRSLIHVKNLCSFTQLCVEEDKAAGETFNVADRDFSTPQLVRVLANSYQLKSRLFPCPLGFLRMVASIFGKKSMIDKLTGSLVIKAEKARDLLNWRPDQSVYSHHKASNFAKSR